LFLFEGDVKDATKQLSKGGKPFGLFGDFDGKNWIFAPYVQPEEGKPSSDKTKTQNLKDSETKQMTSIKIPPRADDKASFLVTYTVTEKQIQNSELSICGFRMWTVREGGKFGTVRRTPVIINNSWGEFKEAKKKYAGKTKEEIENMKDGADEEEKRRAEEAAAAMREKERKEREERNRVIYEHRIM
jgi:hypothetical protein